MSNENGCHFAASSVWTEGQHGTLHLADVDSKEVPDHERPETPAPTTQYHRQTMHDYRLTVGHFVGRDPFQIQF